MWKYDGLCQRIVATIHGLVIAAECDLAFKMIWMTEERFNARFNRDYSLPNDTPADPRLVFEDGFLSRYLFDDKDIYYPPELTIQQFPNGAGRPGRNEITMNSHSDYLRARHDRAFFGLAPHVMDDTFVSDCRAKCRTVARSGIFSDEIAKLLKDGDAIDELKSMWAVHLRGGDIVYGEVRKQFPRRCDLSLTVPLAIDICRVAAKSDKKVIVLGATNQDIAFVLSQCPNAIGAYGIDLAAANNASAVIRDVVVMSRCEKLFSAQSSGVARLATYLGCPEWITADDVYTPDAHADVLKSALAQDALAPCHDLQKAFVYYTLFVLAWDKDGFDALDSYLEMAFKLDPENLSYLALRYLNCLSFSKFGLANRAKAAFLERAAASGGRQGRNLTGHVGIRSKFMEEFLRHIHKIETLPDSDARRIGGWIDRFYDKI